MSRAWIVIALQLAVAVVSTALFLRAATSDSFGQAFLIWFFATPTAVALVAVVDQRRRSIDGRRVLQSLIRDEACASEEFNRAVNGLGLYAHIMDPNLDRPGGFEPAQHALSKAYAALDEHRGRSEARLARFHAVLAKTRLGEDERRDLRRRMDGPETQAIRARLWATLRGIVDGQAAYLDLLQRTRGTWRWNDDRLEFDMKEDWRAFHAIARRVDGLYETLLTMGDRIQRAEFSGAEAVVRADSPLRPEPPSPAGLGRTRRRRPGRPGPYSSR